jgi:hypothetical protein
LRLLSVRPDSRRRRIGVLRPEDLAGFQFGFVCFQGFAGRKSFPPSQPAPRARHLDRRAREGEHSGDRAWPCDVRPRARCSVASAICDSRPVRSTTRLAGVCSHAAWVSGRAWPRRILVIGGRRNRIARLHIFRNRILQILKSRPQMRFRTRLLVSCHSRVSGNPGSRHVRPSLDARFRGHDTDVSESFPHFERLTRLALRQINVQYPGSTAMVQPKRAGGGETLCAPARAGRFDARYQ